MAVNFCSLTVGLCSLGLVVAGLCSLAAVRESRLVYLPRHFQWRVKMGHLGLFWLAGVVVLAFLDPPLKMTWQETCVARNIMTSRTTRTTEDGGLLLAGGCGVGAPACFSGRRSGGLVLALADVGWCRALGSPCHLLLSICLFAFDLRR